MNIHLPSGLAEFTVLFVQALLDWFVSMYNNSGCLKLAIALTVLVIFTAYASSKCGTDENAPFDLP